MDTKEILKKIKNNTVSTNELKKFSKDKQVIIAAVKKDGNNLKFADKQLKADKDKKIIKWFESLSLWSRDQLLGLNKDKDPFGD